MAVTVKCPLGGCKRPNDQFSPHSLYSHLRDAHGLDVAAAHAAAAEALLPAVREESARREREAADMRVEEICGGERIDRESGSLVVERRFRCQRPDHLAHMVTIEIGHDGYPENEACDCAEFRNDGSSCAHITAVLDTQRFFVDIEG